MTKNEIAKAINKDYSNVYAVTVAPTKIVFKNNKFIVGYFNTSDNSSLLEKENKYTFIKNNNNIEYKKTKNPDLITIVNGDEIAEVIYPSYPE